MGYAATPIMTMTAGAHSRKPSLRSARAPADSRRFLRLCLAGATPGAATATVLVLVLIGPFLSRRPGRCLLRGGSRDQPLLLQGITDLAGHALLGVHRIDAGWRRDQVRDVDGHDLVVRRLRPHAGGLEPMQDLGVERVVGEHRRIAVEAGESRREAADRGAPAGWPGRAGTARPG